MSFVFSNIIFGIIVFFSVAHAVVAAIKHKVRKNQKKKPYKKNLSHGAEARDTNANSQKSSDVVGCLTG